MLILILKYIIYVIYDELVKLNWIIMKSFEKKMDDLLSYENMLNKFKGNY